jgi:MFS transporter, DHA1 family, tetracycline resistance protein
MTELGIFYAVLSGIMVLIQGPILRKALKKFSEEKLVMIGSLIFGLQILYYFHQIKYYFINLCSRNFVCSW